jgi:hypothetical protein
VHSELLMFLRRSVLAVMISLPAILMAQAKPQPPCGGEPVPAWADLNAAPATLFWDRSPQHDWTPPACTGWTSSAFSTLVATAGRFHGPASSAMLDRIGAVSHLAGMRYWSTTHQAWQTLITNAAALASPQSNSRRSDFSATDLRPGAVLYFEQTDNLAGKAIFRLHIHEASDIRIVFDVENVTPMRYLLLTLFHPGELQSIYFLDRDGADVWRYYSLTRTGAHASSLTTGKPVSAVNRAVAYYRRFAGIPEDLEPPAAR